MSDAILVTGGTGFIGTHLTAALRRSGRTVFVHSQRDGDIAACELPYTGVRHVFHLAARTFVPRSWIEPALYYATNVLGTVNVLEFCRRAAASLTFVSSYVYGPPQRLPIDEAHPLQPYNPYSHTKILAESAVQYYGEAFAIRAAIVRPFNVYGPGQAAQFLIPEVIRQALDPNAAAIVVGDLRPRRDYLYVSDLVSLLIATIDGAPGVYNAGSGGSASVEEVVEAIRRIAATDKPVRSSHQPRANEILDLMADVSRASRELGWRPRVTLEEGLTRTVASMSMMRSDRF
jgi:nucleoside-diphosphate-sugar epimerase